MTINVPKPGDRFPCVLCLLPDAAEFRYDRKGKPYVTCLSASCRLWYRTTQHIGNALILQRDVIIPYGEKLRERGLMLAQQIMAAARARPIRPEDVAQPLTREEEVHAPKSN